MSKKNEQNLLPDDREQEKQPPGDRRLAKEILRLCDLAEGFGVPVILDIPEFRMTIQPDRSTTICPKKQAKG